MNADDRRLGLDDLLAMLPRPEPPLALKGKIMAAVRSHPRVGLVRRLMPLALGASAVLAVFLLRPNDPKTIPVGRSDLHVDALVGYHTVALTADPLANPVALTAIGADVMRRAAGGY